MIFLERMTSDYLALYNAALARGTTGAVLSSSPKSGVRLGEPCGAMAAQACGQLYERELEPPYWRATEPEAPRGGGRYER